eukprot:CAMPEP_0174712672 /NCGR_PEP_ID=MMETSP1094-20130205/13595_1 /TAXON_ID=156173 /ORGANISM="Chrysochromulina brevifilum, Strain UTEX LB 985" /LENGTH=756 /DNA_ID=CAMNT_0015911767 /DNA_START=147 /DNA_END=2413 /DNA_ORIENTATION=-
MTTIGYGDISPRTPLEACITIVVQLFGAVLFGWIIGNIATLIADFNQYEVAYRARMENIKNYLNHVRIPHAMKERVRKFSAHYYHKKGVMRETWDFLPPRMRRELLALENVDFYSTFSRLHWDGCDEVRQRIAEAVRPYHAIAGQHIVDGMLDACTEVIFVAEGEVMVLQKNAAQRLRRSSSSNDDERAFGRLSALPCISDRNSQSSQKRRRSSFFSGVSQMSSSTSSEVEPDALDEPVSARSRVHLGTKRVGTWFGHVELLALYDEMRQSGDEVASMYDTRWNHSFKARGPSELLFLVKDDFFLILDEFPFVRDLMMAEPEVDIFTPAQRHTHRHDRRRGSTNTHPPCRDASTTSGFSDRSTDNSQVFNFTSTACTSAASTSAACTADPPTVLPSTTSSTASTVAATALSCKSSLRSLRSVRSFVVARGKRTDLGHTPACDDALSPIPGSPLGVGGNRRLPSTTAVSTVTTVSADEMIDDYTNDSEVPRAEAHLAVPPPAPMLSSEARRPSCSLLSIAVCRTSHRGDRRADGPLSSSSSTPRTTNSMGQSGMIGARALIGGGRGQRMMWGNPGTASTTKRYNSHRGKARRHFEQAINEQQGHEGHEQTDKEAPHSCVEARDEGLLPMPVVPTGGRTPDTRRGATPMCSGCRGAGRSASVSMVRGAAPGSASPRSTAGSVVRARRASSSSDDYFKQRVSVELLGDPLRPAWEINEDQLFRRLAAMLETALSSGGVPGIDDGAASGVASGGGGGGGG